MSRNIDNLVAYSSFITGLNGRFGRYLKNQRIQIKDLTDITGLSNSIAKLIMAILILISSFAVYLKWDDSKEFLLFLLNRPDGILYVALLKVLFLIYTSVFIWRLFLVIKYKPTPVGTDNQLPFCTVIIPAYNEGRQVLHTLRSVVRSDYPIEKLQIIAVDDGSKDDTLYWMEKAQIQFPSRIELVKLEKNSGKRVALYKGFMMSKGQVIVTIDSDSLVEPHTIRTLLSPFVKDSNVGAVAGCVRVLNLHQGIIPRMLDVAFAFSFDFYRASQSQVDSVFCTPGALSAYLKKPLMDNLDRWMNQKFLGRNCTIGEDRAMTNFILKDGYSVKFQSNAIVYTNVPTRYKQLCKMLLRWARSNVRETLYMSSFIFKNFRTGKKYGARINFTTSFISMAIPKFLITAIFMMAFIRPDVLATQLILGALVASFVQGTFYYIRRRSFDAIWAFAYSVFSAAALSWITLYALITARNGKWLTREIVKPDNTPKNNPSIDILPVEAA